MVLDSKFLPIHVTSAGENVIVCTKFEEAFFNILNISVSNNYSIIAECVKTIDNAPIVKIDVAIADKVYKNVEFKIILGESVEAFVNEKSLKSGRPIVWKESPKTKIEEQSQKLEQAVKRAPKAPAVAYSAPPVNIEVLRESAQVNQESYILECLQGIQVDLNKKFSEIIRISKEAIIHETFHAQEKLKVQNTQNLTHDVENIIKGLNNQISKIRVEMDESIKAEYKRAFEALKQGQKNLAEKSKSELSAIISEQARLVAIANLEEVSKKSDAALNNQWDKIEKILSNHSAEESKVLEERIELFQSDFFSKQLKLFDANSKSFLDTQDQWIEESVQYKIDSAGVDINKELKKAVVSLSAHINELHEQKITAIKESVNDILEVDESLITEARTSNKTVIRQLFDSYKVDINKELQGQVSIIQKDLNRKAAQYASEYGGGGGSVAMQFAAGGTMNGSLDVRGHILSGGVDLLNIFSGNSGGSQTLSFNESTGLLTITPLGNTVSLSALSGSNTANSSNWDSTYTTVRANSAAWIIDSTTDTGVRALTANWENTYVNFSAQSPNNTSVFSTVQANSASWAADSTTDTGVRALTAGWQNTSTAFSVQSANNDSVYSTVQANSSTAWNYQGTDVKALTGTWQSTTNAFNIQSPSNVSVFTTVQANSAAWAIDSTTDTGVRTLTGTWQNTSTAFAAQSANNAGTFATVQANSATTWNYQGTDIKALTATWQATTDSFNIQSPSNVSVFTTVQANSAAWAIDSTTDTGVRALTSNWQNTYTTVNANSASWAVDSTTDTGVRSLTATWQSTTTAFNIQSPGNISVYTTVQANSATWSGGITVNSTTISGASANAILINSASNTLQTITPGAGVISALSSSINNTGGFLTYSMLGLSGGKIPLLSTSNTWTGTQNVQNIIPTSDNTYSLGVAFPGNRFYAGWFSNSVAAQNFILNSGSGASIYPLTFNSKASVRFTDQAGSTSAPLILGPATSAFCALDIQSSILQVRSGDNLGNYPFKASIVYDLTGNSNQWNAAYTAVNANSASWQITSTAFASQSANNASTYSTLNTLSANDSSVYSTVNASSATWLTSNFTGKTIAAGTFISPTLTSPILSSGGYIADANGKSLLTFVTAASATNQMTLTNAASGSNPTFTPTGNDVNLGETHIMKGTGSFTVKAGTNSGNSQQWLTSTGAVGAFIRNDGFVACSAGLGANILYTAGLTTVLGGQLGLGGANGFYFNALGCAGPTQFNGAQSLTGPGAINLSTTVTKFTSTGAAQSLTLADGSDGQIKIIVHVVAGGSGILTPTTKTGFTALIFAAAGDTATLMFNTTIGWTLLASKGTTITP